MSTSPAEAFDPERFFDLSVAASEEWAKRNATPRVIERTIATDRPVAVTYTSDWHIGNPGTSHRQLRDDMLRLADHPRMFVEIGGDWGDNFIVSKLMHAGAQNVFAAGDQQWVVLALVTKPLFDSESVLAVRTGNHDQWTKMLAGVDPLFANFGNVPHLCCRDGSLMILHVGAQTYRIYRRHRPRWHSVFNDAHCIITEYQRGPFEFDIGVMEHHHLSNYALFNGKERDDGAATRLAIRTGTYKLSDRYAEEHGYEFASSEQVSVILWPDRFRFQPVKGLAQAQELVDVL